MNKLETFVHSLVVGRPKLKRLVRNIYQLFRGIFFSPRLKDTKVDREFLDCFGGFHDVQIFNHTEDKILLHCSDADGRPYLPDGSYSINIAVGDIKTGEIQLVAKTSLFNWQMGARLQWLPGAENTIVFNTLWNDRHSSVFIRVDDGQCKNLKYPIYTISHSGEMFVTCDFNRIEKHMKGYGYWQINRAPPFELDFAIIDKDANIIKNYNSTVDKTSTFVTHFQFSPDDKMLGYFVRFPSITQEYYTKLEILNLKTHHTSCLENFEYITHFCWLGAGEILLFGKNKLRTAYFKFDVKSGELELFQNLGDLPDGHPTFQNNLLVTDTYPNRDRVCSLYAQNQHNAALLVQRRHALRYSDYSRVDFHPKLSRSAKWVSIDTIKNNNHTVQIFSV